METPSASHFVTRQKLSGISFSMDSNVNDNNNNNNIDNCNKNDSCNRSSARMKMMIVTWICPTYV